MASASVVSVSTGMYSPEARSWVLAGNEFLGPAVRGDGLAHDPNQVVHVEGLGQERSHAPGPHLYPVSGTGHGRPHAQPKATAPCGEYDAHDILAASQRADARGSQKRVA